jgi:hypothetical protein
VAHEELVIGKSPKIAERAEVAGGFLGYHAQTGGWSIWMD